jgi:mRNA-degrading endonuclease RelE of RelBE toxin-antitoxin system
MASYAIDLRRLPERELRSIADARQAHQILVAIQDLAEDPHRGEQNPSLTASFVYDVSGFRLAYIVDEQRRVVHILSIFKTLGT